MKFKNGEKITCVNIDNSYGKLRKGQTYITKGDSYIEGESEYVDLDFGSESDNYQMFYASRFIRNIKEDRKDKLKKLNLCLIVQQ